MRLTVLGEDYATSLHHSVRVKLVLDPRFQRSISFPCFQLAGPSSNRSFADVPSKLVRGLGGPFSLDSSKEC